MARAWLVLRAVKKIGDGARRWARLERAQHLREQPRDLGLAQRVRPSQMGGEVAASAVLHSDVEGIPAERVVQDEDGVHLDELRVLQPRQLHRLFVGLARRAQARARWLQRGERRCDCKVDGAVGKIGTVGKIKFRGDTYLFQRCSVKHE